LEDVGILGRLIYDASGKIVTSGTNSITFTSNSADPLLDLSIFEGVGSVYFGIEGLIPGAPMQIISQLYVGSQLLMEDIVEIKVTPFVAFSHESPVETISNHFETICFAVDHEGIAVTLKLQKPRLECLACSPIPKTLKTQIYWRCKIYTVVH
jgi:hypothetical protein